MTTTSIGTKLGFRKITARIGAEVTGVSTSLELDPETVAGDIPVGIDGQPSYSVTGDASHYTPVATAVAAGQTA